MCEHSVSQLASYGYSYEKMQPEARLLASVFCTSHRQFMGHVIMYTITN